MDAELKRLFKIIERGLGLPPKQTAREEAGQLDNKLKSALRPLIKTLVEGDNHERDEAIRRIRTSAPAVVRRLVVDLLIDVLRSPVESRRTNAIKSLAQFGSLAVAVLESKLCQSRSARSRDCYVKALVLIAIGLEPAERIGICFTIVAALYHARQQETPHAQAAAIGGADQVEPEAAKRQDSNDAPADTDSGGSSN